MLERLGPRGDLSLAIRDRRAPRLERGQARALLFRRRIELLRAQLELARPRFDRGEQGVERPRRIGEGVLGFRQHLGAHAQPPRDGQPVGATRHALQQAVRRRQRLRVELERGVHDPHGLRRQLLQRTQVRGRQRHRAPAGERPQHRGGERRPLGWVGAAAHLVEQNERLRTRPLEDVAQRSHVRREGRQARRDRLAVADVGKDLAEHRELGLGTQGWNDTALRQQADQADGLDQHRLAAGVGAGHEQSEFIGSERQVERDD